MKNRARYEKARHHAWAGLGFLSVFLAVRYFVDFPDYVALSFMSLLIFYILVSLFLTYFYSSGLSEDKPDKEELKLEKKRLKAKVKADKKRGKK